MSILVAIPYLPSMPQLLQDRMREQADALYETNSDLIEVVVMDGAVAVPASSPRYTAHATARNRLLDQYLRSHHTHVLWIDSDLTRYPVDLPEQLLEHSDGGMIAPMVVIEETQAFYDTHGFIEASGRAFVVTPPYARQHGEMIDCQAVGCCYLVPASLYHHGARYSTTAGHTEHYSVCQAARAGGLPVRACRSIRVEHANLPRYGLMWN